MKRSRKLVLTLAAILLLVVLLPVGAFYWRLRHALPQYDGEVKLAGLHQPVRILRDPRAVPHIYAQSLDDLLFAQGFVHAQERLWQMDFLRRAARGQLAEILGAAALELDKQNRLLALGSAADRAFEALDDQDRAQLEAYAGGVNAFIRSRSGPPLTSGLPAEFALLGYRPDPWQPADSLALVLNMFKTLTTVWRSELARARIQEMLDPEMASDLFVTASDHDHPIAVPVRRPPRRRRGRVFVAGTCRHSLDQIVSTAALPLGLCRENCGASNNWVVAGAHTASGAALLANDTHLPHSNPAVWFINHLVAPDLDVAGFSLPGIPFVIMGHNRDIAWGVTNLEADLQDLFIEQFDPDDPSRYLTPNGWQTVQRRVEHISVRGADDVDFEVLETRHGPIVHQDGPLKLALQWTARDTSQFSLPLLALSQARNWEEFSAALAEWGAPPQNFVYADRAGHIGYHAAGRIPLRRTGRGHLPVPGHTNRYDWVDYLPFEALPHAFDPPEGILATANNRTVPRGYPYHLTERWAPPARIHRIYGALNAAVEEERKLTPDDFLRLQGDVLSLPDRFLAQQLRAAAEAALDHPPRRAEALAILAEWDGRMQADSAAPLIVDATRRRLLEELLRPHLDDDWRAYSWPMAPVFLEDVLRQRPPRWLPEQYDSYDALLLAALDAAVERIFRQTRTPALDRLRWGQQVRVRFAHPVWDRVPFLRSWFSVGGEPQSGGRYTVKQTRRTAGPSQRMVVDWADLDATLMNITVGQSGHVAGPHYQDQYRAWLEVRSFPAPFTALAVERAARHTLHLLPR